ncbi:hypothetical protein MUK42_17041 [Musa troglodytarum]|uniref:Uncharacterized protein n=1 Tax=Musa troglodytarum TaxID=320322 RepID=A0A9E7L8H5_9LILI|nr:hypothetical protein MUK42_17041 [Musa troglodytarum]
MLRTLRRQSPLPLRHHPTAQVESHLQGSPLRPHPRCPHSPEGHRDPDHDRCAKREHHATFLGRRRRCPCLVEGERPGLRRRQPGLLPCRRQRGAPHGRFAHPAPRASHVQLSQGVADVGPGVHHQAVFAMFLADPLHLDASFERRVRSVLPPRRPVDVEVPVGDRGAAYGEYAPLP